MSMLSLGGVRSHARAAVRVATTLLVLLAAPGARAFDFQDGRLQIHGDFEEQIRALSKDFSLQDNIDLAQWYNVISVETEYDFAPNGWGPFDVLSGYARIEARYDCIWTHACGIFQSVDSWGNHADHLPGYKTTGHRSGFFGSLNVSDQPTRYGVLSQNARYTQIGWAPVIDSRTGIADAAYVTENPRRPARIDQLDGFTGLFGINGANGIFEKSGQVSEPFQDPDTGFFTARNDDPAYFYFSQQLRCKFGSRFFPAGANGVGNQIIGPINTSCNIDPTGALNKKPNPFNFDDLNPIVVNPQTGELTGGSAEMPARPASEIPYLQSHDDTRSKGVYYPSPAYRRFLANGKASVFDQNFGEQELAWNHGGSQQDEHEFKEGYLDMEFFDSRLWIRAGKQNIVWGKTELFRTTDQFNPQDLALASLPSLEESRIALWSVRGVWSFYDVGPLEDVRLEVAANLDDFEPNDIGRCGEPFTALVACNKTTALWAHGLVGVALAGEHRPDPWWQDPSGLSYGARLEFRYGRFSFQVSDFYGYDTFPYVHRLSSFENRKDPVTGRPERIGSSSGCVTGVEPGCLPLVSNQALSPTDPKAADPLAAHGDYNPLYQVNQTTPPLSPDPVFATPSTRENTLVNYAGNIQGFAAICATSIGFNNNDTRACGQSVFNSKAPLTALGQGIDIAETDRPGVPSVAAILSNTLAGNRFASTIVKNFFTGGVTIPYIPLNVDPCDSFLSNGDGTCSGIQGRTGVTAFASTPTLNQTLTDEQEALLGCGPFFGTDCEKDGIDLLNAEASVLLQTWPGIEGNYGKYLSNHNFLGYVVGGTDPNGNPFPMPGTSTFVGAKPGARVVKNHTVQLPGARSPNDAGYNVNVDGSNTGLVIPAGFGNASGLQVNSEMAALSWNMLMTLVAFSAVPNPISVNRADPDPDQFAPDDPYRTGPGLCSLLQPQYCNAIQSFFSITGAQRKDVKAGGTGQFGRRDFQWHGGGEGVLEYQKRNVLGLSADFAEDVTKTNWGIETTWIGNNQFTDNNSFAGVNRSDTLNMTVSVDRPTFINFLNPNRTFFFNSQVFFQYVTNYQSGFTSNGPFNMLGTFTVQTGYFQDRLLPGITFVYDLHSDSGAALPSMTYRFTENFSATIGVNLFWGRFEYDDTAIAPLGTLGSEVGKLAYKDAVENGLSVVRERDEVFLRIRYTF